MDVVKTVIHKWDPINLLSLPPEDEYHSEIRTIECLIYLAKDYLDLADAIYDVFLKSFGGLAFQKTKADCVVIAQKILSTKEETLS